MSGTEVDMVLGKLGGYGRYQWQLLVTVGLVGTVNALHTFVLMFVGWTPEHHCTPWTNFTLNQSLPWKDNDSGEMAWSQCSMYQETGSEGKPYGNTTVSCQHGWTYVWDRKGETSVVSDWDLVCDQSYVSELSVTVLMIGAACGTFFLSPLADRWGRKTVMMVCLLLQTAVGVVIAFTVGPIGFVLLQFFEGAFHTVSYVCANLILVETFDKDTRVVPTYSLQFFYSGGKMLLCLMAYLFPQWRHLQLSISVPLVLMVTYVWLVPESLSWLLITGKIKRAKKIILKIVLVNKLPPCDNLDKTLDPFKVDWPLRQEIIIEPPMDTEASDTKAGQITGLRLDTAATEDTEADHEKVLSDTSNARQETVLLSDTEAGPETVLLSDTEAGPETVLLSDIEADPETVLLSDIEAGPETALSSDAKANPETVLLSDTEAGPETVLSDTKAARETALLKAGSETVLISDAKAGQESVLLSDTKTAPETVLLSDTSAGKTSQNKNEEDVIRSTSYTKLDLFRTPRVRRNSIIMLYLSLVNSLAYYGISFSMPLLSGDKYINTLISGAVEWPAIVAIILVNRRSGRRMPSCVFLLICAGANLIEVFVPSTTASGADLSSVRTALVMVGKFGITGAYSILVLFGTEVFPTFIRSQAMGLCVSFECLGCIVSPQILYLAKTMTQLPMTLFSVLTMVGAALVLLLPETHNAPLPQTIDDAERCDKKRHRKTKSNGNSHHHTDGVTEVRMTGSRHSINNVSC